MTFKKGDKVRVVKQYFGGPSIGKTATVARGDFEMYGDNHTFVNVQWDNGYSPTGGGDGWYSDRFELVEESPNLGVPKPGEVNALIEKYAADLRKGIDNGTIVAPYSEIGIFASFLLDYNNLETE